MNKRKIASWGIYFLAFFFGVILCFELAVRLHLKLGDHSLWKIAMFDHVQSRIDRLWELDRDERPIFWGPPYEVYWNEGFDDPERMQKIYNASILPSGKWDSPNFLRNPEEGKSHYFKVEVNEQGFRDREELSIQKPKKTKRIFVLGSYPAFGHGVDNEDTYAEKLEQKLNQNHNDYSFEVWNGGQQGSVAIMGLARLQKEIHRYAPDLIIFDFGWVDFYMRQDQTPEAFNVPFWEKDHWNFSQKLGAKLRFDWFPNSLVVRILDQYTKASFLDLTEKQWRQVTSEVLKWGQEHEVPLLFVRNYRERVPPDLYSHLLEKNDVAFFVDTSEAFKNATITKQMKEEFWSGANWLTELGVSRNDSINPMYYLKIDALQFNRFGHEIIGRELLPHVEKALEL